MVPFGPFAAIIKGKTPFDSGGSKASLPTRRDSGPPRTNILPIDRRGFAEGFVFFRTLYGALSAEARSARNCRLECGPLSGQARGETLCFLIASVRTECAS